MSDAYQTDEEQIETLKKWWSENGTSLLGSIAVALAAVFGWQAWQDHQQTQMETASTIYQDMLLAAEGTNGVMSETQQATANHLANTLREDYPNSAYARFAALYQAKFAVNNNELDKAEQELRWILTQDTLPEMKTEATLRLARVLYAQDKYDDALALLDTDSSAYAAAFEEVRGDIYYDQGLLEQASISYLKAQQLGQESGSQTNNSVLQIKIEQLNSKLANSGIDAGDA